MLTFAKLGSQGRLGNQLFQIAALISLAKKNNTDYLLPQWSYQKYFPNYKPTLEEGLREKASKEWPQVGESHFEYADLTLDRTEFYNVTGYFQSEKNFHDPKYIKKLFEFDDSQVMHHVKGLQGILGIPSCGIHVRRGDYVNHPSYFNAHISYYRKAMGFIQDMFPEMKFTLFSDDIPWCEAAFKDIPFDVYFNKGNSEIQDLFFMSQCDHFICSNSTFSWWGAFLGEKPGSQVIFPSEWFKGDFAKKNNSKDVLPDRWHKGAPEISKIDLSDVTFTIPVMYDHPDRKANLDLLIHFIRTHFNTHLIVSEWQTSEFRYTSAYGKYMHYHDKGAFHRTRMLNDMAIAATTKFIFNYDADVFFDPLQIFSAVEKLRKENISGCYPYDGRFYRVQRDAMYLLEQSMQVSDFCLLKYPDLAHSTISYGGAILWNKEKFIALGMENQNMISFGPEDYERFDRAKRLGFLVERTKGPLFHINHYCGDDSNSKNPYYAANWKEYEEIKIIPQSRLLERIESWSWRQAALKTISGTREKDTKYDKAFFEQINESALKSADIILPLLKSLVNFKTVLDVGCGQGAWGVGLPEEDYFGVDGDYVKEENLVISPSQFKPVDVSKKFNLRKKFDLVISLEVAEHLPESAADIFIENLCRHGDLILFSAAIPGQGGNAHLNEQWQSYWADKFIRQQFFVNDVIRERIWSNIDIPYYYKQNAILYSKNQIKSPSISVLNIIHPEKYLQLLK